jgi:fatty acid desaturase
MHHGHFAEEGLDGEYRSYVELGLGKLPAASPLESARILLIVFLRKSLWRIHSDYFSAPWRLLALALIAAVLYALGVLHFALLYWVLPYFVVYMPLRYLSEVSEHMGMPLESEFTTARNKLGWFQEWIMHPHGDGFHLVHHLYPGVPHQHLKQVHNLLMQDPVYREQGKHTHGLLFAPAGRRSTLGELVWQVPPTIRVPEHTAS